MKRFIRSNLGWLLCLILLCLMVFYPLINSVVEAPEIEAEGNISFLPNVIPELTLTPRTGRNNESFRFEWYNNTFDLELFFNATYERQGVNETRLFSLKDFEDDFNVTVDYQVNQNESNVQFGWVIDNVENVSDLVDSAWFKIEDTQPFDYEDINVEVLPVQEEPFNLTRFYLPDNLVLSFDDLYDKGFIIGSKNKTFVNVKGFKDKSSWNLDPITYSAPTITVTGYTEGSPADFDAVYQASVSGGWGVVNRFADASYNYAYQFGALLEIGNTSSVVTWFADTRKLVAFNRTGLSFGSIPITVRNNATFRLGQLVDATEKVSQRGCTILVGTLANTYVFNGVAGSDVNIYSSTIINIPYQTGVILQQTTGGRIWNSIMHRITGSTSSQNLDIYRVNLEDPQIGIQYVGGTIEDILITNIGSGYYGVYFVSNIGALTLENIKIREINANGYAVRMHASTVDRYLVNPDFSTWSFYWTGTPTAEIHRQYEFDLNVTDSANSPIQNANVTVSHYGQGESQDFSILTGSNGSFATQTLTMGFYNQTGGNTIYDYNDYNLTITHASYATKTFNFTLEEQIDWQVSLDSPSASNFARGIGSGFILAVMICSVLGLAGLYKIKKR